MDVARLDDIKAALDQLWQSFEHQAERHYTELKSTVQKLLTEQPLTAHLNVDAHDLQCDYNLKTAITLIQEYMAEGRKVSKAVEILRSLAFDSIHDRHDHIEQAHQRSCLWVYDPDRTNFTEWLGSGSGIYWINGLAGSGKSTLMKFITADDRTRRTLVGWAGDLKLITAGHYFWNAGTKMQKSHQGLLQTLLYQIIMAEHSLCDALCPDHCPETPWSMQELTTVFERLSAASQTTSMLCFFIDGLDEYLGPEEAILKVVKSLSAAPNIKICASSRPWPAFYAEWNNSIFTFKMQDFSRDDMTRYVKEYLQSSEKFRSAAARDSRCLDLIPDISNKADGVWLWVYLVVRNILRDIRDGEPFQQWRNRLDSYPQELDAYFRKMMERIDPFHRRQGSEIFLLALAACSPILLLGLRMLYDECIPQDATTRESYLLTEDELAQIYVAWQPRLQNRCGDLMRLSCNFSREHACERYEVEFLHRTVMDFLQEHYFSDLRALVSTNFNEAACLARLILVTIEHVSFGRVMKQDSQRSLINMFFQYVRDAQNAEEIQQQPSHHFKLVDAFDSTMERLLARSGKLHAADHRVSWVQWASGDDGE
ncbi:hypothetical protein HD806DRAFT_520793 [Xylariaceae sp. AK1471]|nr:hypothetical protein HD806DRAFT_520793 [Xylariaceae sp. AK1471]